MSNAATTTDWRNWSGTQSCRPGQVHQPSDAAEIAAIVNRAVAEGSTVRPLGAGHSFTPVACTDGHRVQLDRMGGVVGVDDSGTGEGPTGRSVTVRAAHGGTATRP